MVIVLSHVVKLTEVAPLAETMESNDVLSVRSVCSVDGRSSDISIYRRRAVCLSLQIHKTNVLNNTKEGTANFDQELALN